MTSSAPGTLVVLCVSAMGVWPAIGDRSGPSQSGRGAPAAAPPQTFSKDWKMEDLLPSVVDLGTGHDWAKGRELFKKAACGTCHAFGSESEGTGDAGRLHV